VQTSRVARLFAFAAKQYYKIKKNISTNIYGGTMPQKYFTFSHFEVSKF